TVRHRLEVLGPHGDARRLFLAVGDGDLHLVGVGSLCTDRRVVVDGLVLVGGHRCTPPTSSAPLAASQPALNERYSFARVASLALTPYSLRKSLQAVASAISSSV